MSIAKSIAVSLTLIAALFAALAPIGGARAQTAVETEYAFTEFVPEADGVVPGETLWIAIRQEVREGWHVFWENPGDAGLPLAIEWTLPEGFEAGEPLHPSPEYIPVGPLASFAHEGEPVFLLPLTAPQDAAPGEAIDIEASASWQACEDICVPEEGRFSFSLSVVEEAAPIAAHAPLFAAARAALPSVFEGEAAFSVRGGAYVLELEPPEGFTDKDAFFFPAVEGLITPAAPQAIIARDGALTIEMEPGYLAGYEGETLRGVLAFADDGGARHGIEIAASVSGTIAPPSSLPAFSTASAGETGLLLLFVFAFFGGVILNVMPCVFPIIFVKAASLMQAAGEDMTKIRVHGALYTAGVVATFLAMGGVLLLLRAGGEQLGWGFHLQSPFIVALSAYVLFMVGLNLAGLFHVGESLAGTGESLASRGGGAGAFFTGALAVVVAAPCIGPLLTAPMGAVLLQPPVIGLAILTVMALGLAAPYLALTLAPALGRALPKPGPWMSVLKQALSFPVFAAAAYFLWVFAQQANASGLAFMLSGGVLLALAAWLFEVSKGAGPRFLIVRGLAALLAFGAIAPLTRIEPAVAAFASDGGAPHGAFMAEPFSAEALEAHREAGTPVFVDFTAAWCVTCQFNKLTVFSSEELADDFERAGVVFMVADWTLRDPKITSALEAFGASGVPLYAFYPAGRAPEVLALPLTRESVRERVLVRAP